MKKVFVGMSGGVDSSVAAALLKQQGYEVVGVFMKNWTRDIGGFECPWRRDLADAQSVAARLDIPFTTFDFEKDYRQKVVDYMVDEYKLGRTPNPDIMCNSEIKFKLFLETALEKGADMIATGHYARILSKDDKPARLLVGLDEGKDQSYFLYRLSQEALSRTLFPVGGLPKTQVRKLAEKLKLPTASKPDSQGICFVGEVSAKEFLQEYIETKQGPIKHVKTGKILGQHEGAELYTIGQRHGLGVGGGLPLYVVKKDMGTNTVFVTENLTSLMSGELVIDNLHWIGSRPVEGTEYLVRTRHLGKLIKGTVEKFSGQSVSIVLESPERALTAGQSAVLYSQSHEGLEVVGGGIISL